MKKFIALVLVMASVLAITPVFADTTVALDIYENDVFKIVRGLTVEEVNVMQRFKDREVSVFGYVFTNEVTDGNDFGTGEAQILMDSLYDGVNGITYTLSDGAWVSRWYQTGKAVMFVPKEKSGYDYYEILLTKPSEITVFLNGKNLEFDQKPVTDNDRTLVPLRKIFEELGATVEWDDPTQTVTATKGKTVIKLTVGETTAYKNRAPMVIDVPAKEINGRVLVPVRFVAGCFGVTTDWDEGLQKVTLTSTTALDD